jgi:hypothetical protein
MNILVFRLKKGLEPIKTNPFLNSFNLDYCISESASFLF